MIVVCAEANGANNNANANKIRFFMHNLLSARKN